LLLFPVKFKRLKVKKTKEEGKTELYQQGSNPGHQIAPIETRAEVRKKKPANTTEVLGQTYESNINHKF